MHLRYPFRLATFLLVLFTLPAFGQTVAEAEPEEEEIKVMVRHSLIHWLDPFLPSAQIGIDYRIAPKHYLRHEVGYFFDIGYEDPQSLLGLSGFRFRTAFRSYRRTALPSRRSTYVEFNLDYRYTDMEIAGDFWRDNFNFQQRINYRVWQNSVTGNMQVGQSRAIGKRWRIDLGVGLGLRLNHRKFSSVPDDADFNTNGDLSVWNYDFRTGYSVGLNMPIVVAIGYWW